MDVQTPRPPSSHRSSSLTARYLLLYNAVSLALWSLVLLRTLALIPALTPTHTHGLLPALLPLLTFAQSLALLEPLHSLLRLVRAPFATTAMQVASRLLLIWGILQPFPTIVATRNIFNRPAAGTTTGPYAFAGLLLAWSVTEVVRYGFFAAQLGYGRVPGAVQWARYNTFFLLYPLGIWCECWLIYLALSGSATEWNGMYGIFLKVVLLIYIPGSYILYSHMMAQRRRVMKGKGKPA